MRQILSFLCAVSIFSLATAPAAHTENWSNWRGPNFDGSSPETGLPATFSKTENVKWTASMPGPSAATPAIWGDTVFVSSIDQRAKTLLAIGINRTNGEELWRKQVGIGTERDNRSNFASPSPVTDGNIVVFFYGSGEMAAFKFDGEELWSRNIQKDYGEFAFQWTFSSSPQLFEGKLYLQVLQRDVPARGHGRTDGPNESYLLALDPMTGKELWRVLRPSEAVQESREAFSTPIPFTHEGRDELLIAGGDCISGHDPATGKELWRWSTYNPERIGHWRLVPSPVAGAGVVLVCAPKRAPIYAIPAGSEGNVADADLAWTSSDRNVSSDVATPLFFKGNFYVLNGERQSISRVNPATGEPEWTGELNSRTKIESSPTAADDRIYFMDHRGEVFVVAAGPEFKILHQTNMADADDSDLRSCIAISQGNLFIRTGSKLYCIGE